MQKRKRQSYGLSVICLTALLGLLRGVDVSAEEPPSVEQERMIEWTIESRKSYSDPFNDVDVDVIFSKDGQSWRVPTFWKGGQQWGVRFAPPSPGKYTFRLQSTDLSNPDLNGHEGLANIGPYIGPNVLLRHGMLRVSTDKRHFEHADGTPFFWLGDTWWTGLSDRLSWDGFQRLVANRKAKGFTVVQIVAGLVPYEEQAPSDPGFRNEGGPVWETNFTRINPKYFDYADRRILQLLDAGITPAIVGAWSQILRQMGTAKMNQHWRYIIARYGAYPVFWIVGGEIFDPPGEVENRLPQSSRSWIVHGWTDVTRYIRATDPYHHPVSIHESYPPYDYPSQDESLTDFDMFQSSHFGWSSIAVEVAQMNVHYARTSVTKPIVQGEIGYERLGETHYEDFQRTAFWLSMLNGAAGHTYGANGTWEAYTGDKPLHRIRWSFVSWEEGMNLPGSYQVGLQAKLLQQYHWWRFSPHPEWITPHGTTLLEPRKEINGFDLGGLDLFQLEDGETFNDSLEAGDYPGGEWRARHGNFRRPYAAGIPSEVRIVYMPYFGLIQRHPLTVLGLESGVRYNAYFWEPSSGIRVDLGAVERPPPGATIFTDKFVGGNSATWANHGKTKAVRIDESVSPCDGILAAVRGINETNAVATAEVRSNARAGLVLRFLDKNNYVVAMYSPNESALFLLEMRDGHSGPELGKTIVPGVGASFKLSAEVRDNKAAASVTDGQRNYTTPIVDLGNISAGSAGLLSCGQSVDRGFDGLVVRRSPTLVRDEPLRRSLYDARGDHRGDLVGADWDSFGRDKHILLDAYRPERLPTSGDWVLVLETEQSHANKNEMTTKSSP